MSVGADTQKTKRRWRWWMIIPILLAIAAAAAIQTRLASWIIPAKPMRLIGPIDYVGTKGLSAFLIHTSEGAILIDAPMEWNVEKLERSIRERGVSLRDVKIILLSHAHFDHAGGLAALKNATGAKLIVGVRDRLAVETGNPPGETNYGVIRFAAAKVDQGIKDGERVTLGDVTLTAVSTPGHTPGCTSWQMQLVQQGKPINVLFACSVEVAGNKLVGNRRYPDIVADFRSSMAKLAAMRADVFLTFHPEKVDLLARAQAGTLIDAGRLPEMMAKARTDFERELAKQSQ